MQKKVRVYSSKYRSQTSILKILKELYSDVLFYKWQILLSIKKQIKLTYQQDFFGIFWAIVMPVIPMTIYMILAYVKVFNTVDDMPFIFYIAIGMFIWLLMSTIIRHVMLSIKKEKALLRSTNYPILIPMLIELGQILNDSFIRVFAIVIIVVYFSIDISIYSILISLLILIPTILISLSLGVIFAILDVVIQDIRRAVDIFLRYGIFISSVIFPFPLEGVLGYINSFNIFNTYIMSIRDILFYERINNIEVLVYTIGASIILFFISMKLLYKLDYKIRAYL